MSLATPSIPAWLAASLQVLPDTSVPWLRDFRMQQCAAVLQQGLPKRRDERWRQTDLSIFTQTGFHVPENTSKVTCDVIRQIRRIDSDAIFLLFINGCFVPHLSDIHLLPSNAIACSIHDAILQHSALLQAYWQHEVAVQSHPFAGINAALFADGLFLYLPPQCQLSVPVHIVHLVSNQQGVMVHPRNLIVLDEYAQLTIIEEHVHHHASHYWSNSVNTVVAGKRAILEYHKVYKAHPTACYIALTQVEQKQDSRCRFYHFSSQAQVVRDDLIVKLQEKHAECEARGFYGLTQQDQSITHFVEMDHQAPQCKSNMLYKGVLREQSKAAFHGKVLVREQAQKTQAYQANHHLLLTMDAEASSRPELEIYADDVQCKHGATVGQLDADALFYLCSRGVSRQEAVGLLLSGFVEEVFADINPIVAEQIQLLLDEWLQKSHGSEA
ncbi:MAG: Fe-S cluster assembly protein SufD [Gammaproteobacteria bacterium RIFCSPHIGHO2_12_FULL_41_20]|nr:MAG: Fe-S cluster assembly protein SufD [Gammaproteobacteria bacterium RIFCSPHIGHO2_12_FULL_41_20]